ncbi:7-carboxy-7-deazaguanine synthase QueE [Brevibacillus fluminis]|uniref:7-carboxy-7-deazaguanine synthase n=1 Tax=Brevibacillus fluminis TaxID=511487 RepID=A0A3M8DFP7_9BACL|nr:7-carboxy-7-deazaguanine synthase QueE [Brevibacillus fluminis]RNB86932.1 7-carboxy-7-deazaguanine synthase QueE [Brevibacillus fluminis]
MSNIPVLEIFGPTIQGEGMVIGQKTMFVRTAGCDYRCSWCDSAFTWDGTAQDQIRQLSPEDILAELRELAQDRFSHVTISGGNPALIKSIGGLVELLHANGIRTAIETQGTKWQDWLLEIDEVTISPKPPSSGMTTDFSLLDDMIEKLAANPRKNPFSLKVVVFDEQDFEHARTIHHRYPQVPFFLQVGNDDVHLADDEALRNQLLAKFEWLIDRTMVQSDMNDVKVLPQLHALMWGNKRGV